MLKLPKVPYIMDKNKRQVVSMGSINYSKMTKDGDIADSGGISGRYYPYITTAKDSEAVRVGVVANEKIVAMTVFRGKFVEIDENGKVYYDGAPVGSVATDGINYSDVQFAAINTKLVIMPFKKYLDCGDEENGVSVKSLGAKIATSTATTFEANCVTLDGEAAQSYQMIGGKIEDNRFSAVLRDSGVKYTETHPLAVATSDDSSEWTLVPVRYIGIMKLGGYCHSIYVDKSEILMGGQLIYIQDDTVPGNTGLYLIEDCVLDDVASGLASNKYDVYLDALKSYDHSVEVYVVDYGNIYTPESAGINARLAINRKAKKVESFVSLSTINEALDMMTIPKNQCPGLSVGIYTGTIDNGGWSGDFRDFLSAGRRVTVSADMTYMEGSVSDVGQNYFTVGDNELAFDSADFSNMIVTVTADENKNASFGALFKVGDVVNISGCTIAENNIDFKIDSISTDGKTLYAASDIFTATPDAAALAEETGGVGLVIERRIPTLDYICESDNRLYGCSNEDNTIYVSALGDPTNIYTYQGISTDSYAVPVASEEHFTGCCPYDGGVLFWKTNKLHKLLGSYPAEYALYTYNIDGVEEGSHKSLQNIGEVLYYKGVRGVFAFNGSPQLISSNFGDKYFKDAVAGTDGEHYLISMKDDGGKDHFFSYNTRSGLWVREGDGRMAAFARQGKDVYMLEGGEICRYGAVESSKDSEWFVQFTPIYETIEGQKTYSRIRLRIELPLESYMVISVRCDGGRWAECGKIVGRVDGVVPVVVPINRCDKFELRIEGKGPFVIHSILREYYVGGDR